MIENFLMSIAFSIFGMLLIFGLGFIFPTINPYVAIKWIVIVCGAVFVYVILAQIIILFKGFKLFKKGKK